MACFAQASDASEAEAWYLLGLVHDIAHEHEEMARCMRKAHSHFGKFFWHRGSELFGPTKSIIVDELWESF